jgi:hypothetical protein
MNLAEYEKVINVLMEFVIKHSPKRNKDINLVKNCTVSAKHKRTLYTVQGGAEEKG